MPKINKSEYEVLKAIRNEEPHYHGMSVSVGLIRKSLLYWKGGIPANTLELTEAGGAAFEAYESESREEVWFDE